MATNIRYSYEDYWWHWLNAFQMQILNAPVHHLSCHLLLAISIKSKLFQLNYMLCRQIRLINFKNKFQSSIWPIMMIKNVIFTVWFKWWNIPFNPFWTFRYIHVCVNSSHFPNDHICIRVPLWSFVHITTLRWVQNVWHIANNIFCYIFVGQLLYFYSIAITTQPGGMLDSPHPFISPMVSRA